MTDPALVARKLALIFEHLRRLRERLPADQGTFARDLLLQDAVSMGVLVVVQEAIDVAFAAATLIRQPRTGTDTPPRTWADRSSESARL